MFYLSDLRPGCCEEGKPHVQILVQCGTNPVLGKYQQKSGYNVELLLLVTSVTAEDTASASIQADNEAAKCLLLYLKTKL